MSACPSCPTSRSIIEALRERILGRRLERIRVLSPFLLRSVEPPIDAAANARVVGFERLGKRIAIGFDNDVWLVLHLMIAGRLQWRAEWPASLTRQTALALGFETGTLLLTEAGTKKRASLHVVRGRAALAAHERGGIELDRVSAAEFEAVLKRGNHTLKRALTDPRSISGIGNAYSDEILHRARLSPITLTSRLTSEESARLFAAAREVLAEWLARLREKAHGEFPTQGHRVSRGDGRSRQVRQAVSRLQDEGAAHPLRRQRDELLPALPDQRSLAGRPFAVAAVEEGLAEVDRRAGADAVMSRADDEWPRTIVHADMDAFYAADRATRRSEVARPAVARGVRQRPRRRADGELRGAAVGSRQRDADAASAAPLPGRARRAAAVRALSTSVRARHGYARELLAARRAAEPRRGVSRHDGKHEAVR